MSTILVKTGNFTVSETPMLDTWNEGTTPARYAIGYQYDFTREVNGQQLPNTGTALPTNEPQPVYDNIFEPFIRVGFAQLLPDQGALYNTVYKGKRPRFWVPLEWNKQSYSDVNSTNQKGVLPGSERDHPNFQIGVDLTSQISVVLNDPTTDWVSWYDNNGPVLWDTLVRAGFAGGEKSKVRFCGPDEGVHKGFWYTKCPKPYSISKTPGQITIPGVGLVPTAVGVPAYHSTDHDACIVFEKREGAIAFMRTLALQGVVDFGTDTFV